MKFVYLSYILIGPLSNLAVTAKTQECLGLKQYLLSKINLDYWNHYCCFTLQWNLTD